jgi:hypothetical protein
MFGDPIFDSIDFNLFGDFDDEDSCGADDVADLPHFNSVASMAGFTYIMNELNILNEWLMDYDMPFTVVHRSSNHDSDIEDFTHIPNLNHLLIKPNKGCCDTFYAILLGSIITRRYFRTCSVFFTNPVFLKRSILISLIHAPSDETLEKYRMYTNNFGKTSYKLIYDKQYSNLTSDQRDCVSVDFKHAVWDSIEEIPTARTAVMEDAIEHAAKVIGIRLNIIDSLNGRNFLYNNAVDDPVCVRLVKRSPGRYIGSLDISELSNVSHNASNLSALSMILKNDNETVITINRSNYPPSRNKECIADLAKLVKIANKRKRC